MSCWWLFSTPASTTLYRIFSPFQFCTIQSSVSNGNWQVMLRVLKFHPQTTDNQQLCKFPGFYQALSTNLPMYLCKQRLKKNNFNKMRIKIYSNLDSEGTASFCRHFELPQNHTYKSEGCAMKTIFPAVALGLTVLTCHRWKESKFNAKNKIICVSSSSVKGILPFDRKMDSLTIF